MIYFDVTKTAASSHRSGLTRVTGRLLVELGSVVVPVVWDQAFCRVDTRKPVTLKSTDWLLTAELFSESERPGFWKFLKAKPCQLAAIFHDAIPLKLPHSTWPQSVARHPEYLKMLSRFDRVWAVSCAVRDDLIGWWTWSGVGTVPPVEVLTLGGDFNGEPRRIEAGAKDLNLLCVGIVEPRKNQSFLLKVCSELWRQGIMFNLHIVGRVNPHFGQPVVEEIKHLQRRYPGLHHHAGASDSALVGLYREACATAFPTLAEGCGLPLLESLWLGVPCIASDLPPLRENAAGGGCRLLPLNDQAAWVAALKSILTNTPELQTLQREASSRPIPSWQTTASTLARALA
ncbi:MAG TPA: glycosyltransferase [Opitutaceae bacterium]|nr:glycosyltransferase [Opitutaceae bacterium]